jgi:hypothetical protein
VTIEPVQVPAPSHLPTVVCMPPAHDALTQTVVAAHFAQAPASHVPSVPQLAAVFTRQTPRGSGLPFVTVAQ